MTEETTHAIQLKEFERGGEPEVRQKLHRGIYGTGRERQWAIGWLEAQDRARGDASRADELEVARSARDAAWAAVEKADAANRLSKDANWWSIGAVVVAGLSAIVALIALFD